MPTERETTTTREPKRSVRINVSLSESAYEELKMQSEHFGMDMSEFVRNALRVYNSLQQEKAEGRRVYIGTTENIEKELVVP